MIRFTDNTAIVEVDEENHSIRPENFRIRCHDDLMKLADKNEDLPDVIGFLCNIHKPKVVSESKSKRVMLRILLEEGIRTYVTIWDDLVDCFYMKLGEINEKTIVIVVTSINPKIFGRDLYLNTTSSSKFYLNAEFDIVRGFRERMKTEQQFDDSYKVFESITSGKYCHSISELLEFISNEEEQEKEFTCIAKVTEVLTQKGWNYISCSKCSRKLGKTETRLICNNCNNSQAVGVLRFRIEVVVDDGKDTTTFVIFDRDAKKLTNRAASDLMTIDEAVSDNVGHQQTTPACILDIVGKKFKFQVKVTPYNFRAKTQTFTVSRILNDICKTETEEPNQKGSLAAEGSSRSYSPTIHNIKCEDNSVETDSEELDIGINKRRRVLRKKTKQHISEDSD